MKKIVTSFMFLSLSFNSIAAQSIDVKAYLDNHDINEKMLTQQLLTKEVKEVYFANNTSKISRESSAQKQLDYFFNNVLKQELSKHQILKDKIYFDDNYSKSVKVLVENLVSKKLSSTKQALKVFFVSLNVDDLAVEQVFNYELLYNLNIYLKLVMGEEVSKATVLNDLLLETFFLAAQVREIILAEKSYKLDSKMFSVDEVLRFENFDKESQDFKEFHSKLLKNNNSIKFLDDKSSDNEKIYLGPGIHIANDNLEVRTKNISMHPLALIYAPGKSVKIEAIDNELVVSNLSIVTKGLKASTNSKNLALRDNLLELLINPKVITSEVKSAYTLFKDNMGVNQTSSKYVLGRKIKNDAQNGGVVSIAANKIFGLNFIDASGADGHKGNDSLSAIGCLDSSLSDSIKNNLLKAPTYPTNGQHGGHGGEVNFSAKDQFNSNTNIFVSHVVSNFGEGGSAGILKGCFDRKYQNLNSFKAYKGLSGAYGKLNNYILVD